MSVSDFARSVARFATERALLFPEDRLLIALSGGADSCALLLALCELAEAEQLPQPVGVAHFHHGMRGRDADADAGFCAALAIQCGLPCTVGLGALSGANEAQAREARYAFLREVAAQSGASVLVTGHHADDQAETVLLRVFRGTSVQGLAGIPGRRLLSNGVAVARPLLGQRRAQIESYCAQRGILVRHDPTNDDTRFVRRRLRTHWPELEQAFNPQLVAALNRLAEHAVADNQVLETLTDALWEETLVQEDPLTLEGIRLQEAPLALRRRVLLRALWRIAPGAQEELATGVWVERLGALLARAGSLDLPLGWRARSEGRLLFLERPAPKAEIPYQHLLRVPGSVGLADGTILRASVGAPLEGNTRSRRASRVDCGTIPASLVVRSVAPGDRLAPLGMAGKTRLVRDLLREAGIPVAERSGWPVVVERLSGELLWLVGIAQAEVTRVAEGAATVLILERKRDP